ncbi:MAG: hypothetical protein QJR00_05375, partial [Bacillota bacterium]|nr:hypothetical protein [Bacillota bacterium]
AAALSPFERELWVRREEVAQVLPVLENLRRHRVELADLEPRLQQVERELGPAAERLFLQGSLEKGSLLLSAEGEGRFRRWLAAREERRERERRRREEEEGEARRRREEAALRPLLYLGLGLLGAGILLFFALDAGGLYLGGGGLFALFLWAVLRGRGLADPYLARLVEGEERARQEEKEALAELASTLQPLALAPSLAESLSADELESRFSALRNLLLEREGLLLEKGRREEACRQGEAVLLRLWESLPSPPPQRTYEDLPELFHQTREKAQRALEALEKREGALTEWQEIEAQWKALREHLGALQERFRALAPEAEAGAREAERRLQALQEARILKEELERDGGPLEAIRKAVEKARREGLFAPQEGLKEELQRERGKLQEERDALLARRAELAQGPEPSLLLAQMEEVEEELRRIRRRRDRLFLLQRILEEGQRRFRETFQPETLRLASVYLSSFTGGRYRRLFMDEEEGPPGFGQEGRVDKKGPQLMVEGPDGSFPAAFPLSQGTLHQIYLALRLGLLSHLEGEGEPLPLLLDETLVHFDGQRREATWNILRQVAEHRQVLYFTCHPSMAREAMVKGALLIELPSRQTMP